MSLRSKPFCSGVPGARFSKVLKCFRTRPKAAVDSQTLGLQSCNEAWVKRGPGTKSFKGTLQDSCNAIKLEPESKKQNKKTIKRTEGGEKSYCFVLVPVSTGPECGRKSA